MVQQASPALFSSRPPSFWHFLDDALVVFGLPYGPQARERLARTCPGLFGQSDSTLRGYERWLDRAGKTDTTETFASFMDERYRRWLVTAP